MTAAVPQTPARLYSIRVKGRLDPERWSEWFDGLSVIAQANDETLLTGPVEDQAALYGLLNRLRDLGLPLISVNILPASPSVPDNLL